MATTLEDFRGLCCASLKSGHPVEQELPRRAYQLRRRLANPDFVSSTFHPGDDFGKKVLHRDQETGFFVPAWVHQGPKGAPPHSHAVSWASIVETA